MSRPKVDPVERAFESYVALDPNQRERYDAMICGWEAAMNKQAGRLPTKPARVRKVKAPAEVAA